MNTHISRVRIDKWLWAARFFKTRSIAKQAIDSGKVRLEGARIKASKEIEIGMLLTIRQGWEEKIIEVLALAEQRRGAPEAQRLYRETDDSRNRRQQRTEERKTYGSTAATPGKPTSKQRRQLQRIKREILGDGDER